MQPGQRGTKKWLEQYGDRLVCVRYRYDEQRRRRYTTVEIIVAEAPWTPPPDTVMSVRVEWGEVNLGRTIKAAGGRWDRQKQAWQLRYDQVLALGLLDRLVLPER